MFRALGVRHGYGPVPVRVPAWKMGEVVRLEKKLVKYVRRNRWQSRLQMMARFVVVYATLSLAVPDKWFHLCALHYGLAAVIASWRNQIILSHSSSRDFRQ